METFFIWIMHESLSLHLVQICNWINHKCKQNCVISREKVASAVLFCKETLYVLVDFLLKTLTRRHEKDLIGNEIRYSLQKLIFFEVFKLLSPLDQSTLACAQNIAVLEHRVPRTSDMITCAFRKIFRPVSRLIYQELAIFLIFLHNSLN